MIKKTGLRSISAAACLTIAFLLVFAAAPDAGANPPTKPGQTKSGGKAAGSNSSTTKGPSSDSSIKLYGAVNELLGACANAGIEITSTTLPARIEKVRMGSPAFYAGLEDHDVILKGTLENNRLKITFKRAVSVYAVELATESSADAPTIKLKTSTSPPPSLAIVPKELSEDNIWKRLKNYDITMLIDKSGSMSEPADQSGISKWDWLGKQMVRFADQAEENGTRRFTIIPFEGAYTVRGNCSAADVRNEFSSDKPGGATDLASPLEFVLKKYQHGPHQNPLLIVVLTDGMPSTPDLVAKEIIDETLQMSDPDQIKIVFFLIGEDPDGAALIKYLDIGLVSEGAKYDIVDSKTFGELQQIGLVIALYDCFRNNTQSGGNMQSGGSTQSAGGTQSGSKQSLEAELADVRKQLQQIRERSAKTPANR